jgi:hypothetical protein
MSASLFCFGCPPVESAPRPTGQGAELFSMLFSKSTANLRLLAQNRPEVALQTIFSHQV